MGRWNTEEIVNRVLELRPNLVVSVSQGEDYTTDNISFALDDSFEEALHVRGFDTMYLGSANRSNLEVPLVELTSGYSEGGLVSTDPAIIQLYSDIYSILVARGFSVVGTMDSYF